MMGANLLMSVYALHSSRPGRPPKRSYGASVQDSPRILHHRANSLLSPALLSPTGKSNTPYTHPARFSPQSERCKFRWASVYSLTAPFNTYEKYMLKSLPPLLSFCSSFILSPFLPLCSVIFHAPSFTGDSDEWHTPAGSLIHLFIPLYFPLPLTGQKPHIPRPLFSTLLYHIGKGGCWKCAEICPKKCLISTRIRYVTVTIPGVSFPLSKNDGLFSGNSARKSEFENLFLPENLETVNYFLFYFFRIL